MKLTVISFLLGSLIGYVVAVVTFEEAVVEYNTPSETALLISQLDQLSQENKNLQLQLNHAITSVKQADINTVPAEHHGLEEYVVVATAQQNNESRQLRPSATFAQTVKAIEMYQVLPIAKRLEIQLQLNEDTANKLQALLLEKAQQDYQVWLSNQSEKSQHSIDMSSLTNDLNLNKQRYEQSLREILTDDQVAAYIQAERQQAEVLAQQKLMHLRDSLSKISLDEYQQQEISRLASQLYQTDNVSIGSMGSPYGVGSISVNTEKLEEIKLVLTEEQLQSLIL
ncbi:hypothetical protein N480_22320 [Pseudoalteromonas luteoviolacea S2607]|uniref:hypothetical protein n=1 Tax=Pseudoalteromonas luteoviolacea TaxID=43657 RepID=UPI0007B05E75|nr:hypothetical protein [Pseudoalteromonas luteoviolacea]KZN34342.1 hypothetical protein N480_22320 [Pseudoalteromonas luteoviolacea S2607]